ncbi:MAG TPA: EAL domain-containing protein [Gammaproteobacteria bacterium]|nr:EAL domain-containing protein [Gammaproteobacteria bacterium]
MTGSSDLPARLGAAETFRVVSSLLPRAGAALLSGDPELDWTAGEWSAETADAAAALVRRYAAGDSRVALRDGRELHLAAIVPATAGDPAAFIAVAGLGAADAIGEAAAAAAAVMSTWQRLNGELDAMASELSDRYEELNLVYATSRQSSRFAEARPALENLVESCRDHLDASLVALVLPVQRLFLERHDPRSPVQAVDEFLRVVSREFFTAFAAAARAVVFNEGLGAVADPLRPFGDMKLAATPVLDDREAVCGVLLMANPVTAIDFSNSDRNLLGSVAEKAAKVIQTSYDSLTGLLGRSEFEYRLEVAHARAHNDKESHCVLCIDLDQLHVVNETLGHEAGDALLRRIGRHLDRYQGEGRTAARLGSDDFGLLLENCSLEYGRELAETIRLSVSSLSFSFDDQPVAITASIGVAAMDAESANAAAALQAAELASASAHEKGRDRVHVYQDGAASLVERTEQMRWVGRIHSALRNDRFRMYGQLIRPLHGDDEPHVEILLRLLDDEGNVLSPASFLPAAERYFLMPALDRWVVSHALALLSDGGTGELVCSINLSGQSISDDTFVEFIEGELDRSQVDPGRICFEITETAAITSMETAKRFMLRVKARGCRFSLDDFGTGLSSFSYLKALPVDFVKIDGSFVKGIIDDPVSESMVRAITEVGHAMGLKIIAEYVENARIERCLAEIGVDYAQGYAIERPVPLDQHLARVRPATLEAVS